MDTLLSEHFDYIPTKTLSNLRGILSKRLGVLGRKGCTNQYFKNNKTVLPYSSGFAIDKDLQV